MNKESEEWLDKKSFNHGQSILNYLSIFLLALAGTFSVLGILAVAGSLYKSSNPAALGDALWYTNSFFSFFFFAVNLYIMSRIYPEFHKTTKRNRRFAVLFAFLLSLSLHFGSRLEADGYVTFTSPWLWISIMLFTCYFSVIVHALWEKLPAWMNRITGQSGATVGLHNAYDSDEPQHEKGKTNRIITFTTGIVDAPWKTWLAIFVLWFPVFLAFFPGAFVYDAQDEYVEVAARIFTTHHPLFHVLLLGVPIRAAEHFGLHANVGIACYTIFQMVILSGVFTYMIMLLKKWNCKWQYRLGVLLAIGLFPIFPMYAVCSAKDTLFTTCFLMVLMLLLEDYCELGLGKKLLFVVASVCMMLLRNNGFYAYVFTIPVLLFAGRRKGFKKSVQTNLENSNALRSANTCRRYFKPAFLMIVSCFTFFAASHLLTFALQATNEEHQEILTVSIQQLARTYEFAPDTFTEEEQTTLYEFLSPEALSTYEPKISDILKSQFNNETFAQNSGKYLSLWIKVGMRKPMIYLNAWFLTSYGYWYPDAILNCYGGIERFTFQYTESSYFGFETELPGVRHSLFPILETFYRNISLKLFQQKMPVISMLFSPGFLFWIFLFYYVWIIRKSNRGLSSTKERSMVSRKNIVVIFTGVFLLWLTVNLGPATLVRYVLILWFILPLLPLVMSIQMKEPDK